MKKPFIIILPFTLAAVITIAKIYKWVDEKGDAHFGDRPPEEVSAEKIQLPKTVPKRVSAEDDVDTQKSSATESTEEPGYFSPVSDLSEIEGCWSRVIWAEKPEINIYGFDEPDNQWFCFFENNEMLTYFSTKPGERSRQDLIKWANTFPLVERYYLVEKGVLMMCDCAASKHEEPNGLIY